MLDIKALYSQIQALRNRLSLNESLGDLKLFARIQVLLQYFELAHQISVIRQVVGKSEETIRLWIQEFAAKGVRSPKCQLRLGWQPKLTKNQCKDIFHRIEKPPVESGFIGGCWNSVMIQALINKLFKVEYSVKYTPEFLKRIGQSYQKDRFELNNGDSMARKKWLNKIWPELEVKSRKNNAKIYFEDEASFAMWGSLSYTWSPKGVQPTVKTRVGLENHIKYLEQSNIKPEISSIREKVGN